MLRRSPPLPLRRNKKSLKKPLGSKRVHQWKLSRNQSHRQHRRKSRRSNRTCSSWKILLAGAGRLLPPRSTPRLQRKSFQTLRITNSLWRRESAQAHSFLCTVAKITQDQPNSSWGLTVRTFQMWGASRKWLYSAELSTIRNKARKNWDSITGTCIRRFWSWASDLSMNRMAALTSAVSPCYSPSNTSSM